MYFINSHLMKIVIMPSIINNLSGRPPEISQTCDITFTSGTFCLKREQVSIHGECLMCYSRCSGHSRNCTRFLTETSSTAQRHCQLSPWRRRRGQLATAALRSDGTESPSVRRRVPDCRSVGTADKPSQLQLVSLEASFARRHISLPGTQRRRK